MAANNYNELLIAALKQLGLQFVQGLTDQEIAAIQTQFELLFPPDLRLFLQTSLPISAKFVNWRLALKNKPYAKQVKRLLKRPLQGILFDVQNNDFWLATWGEKPAEFSQQKLIVCQQLSAYPQLIPIYANRYIPNRPWESGNPVLSVYQTDIIYYGVDLVDYLLNEFNLPLNKPDLHIAEQEKNIDFWSQLISLNAG